jgi:chromosome segregation ATPase
VKAELSEHYERLRGVESEKAGTQGALRSLEKDIQEIEEKLRKDEGRKAKIQEELDNLVRQKDGAVGEVAKFQEEQEKLQLAIKEKDAELEAATAELNHLRDQTSERVKSIRQLRDDYVHRSEFKAECNRENLKMEGQIETLRKEHNAATAATASY